MSDLCSNSDHVRTSVFDQKSPFVSAELSGSDQPFTTGNRTYSAVVRIQFHRQETETCYCGSVTSLGIGSISPLASQRSRCAFCSLKRLLTVRRIDWYRGWSVSMPSGCLISSCLEPINQVVAITCARRWKIRTPTTERYGCPIFANFLWPGQAMLRFSSVHA